MEAETSPLVGRGRSSSEDLAAETFSSLDSEEVVVQCCGIESTRLGRVPVIRTLFKKTEPTQKVLAVCVCVCVCSV